MLIKKIHGIITSIRPHMEVDKILHIFSDEYGRIRVTAKGVRKITSRRAGHLDVLNDVCLEVEESGNRPMFGPLYLREITVKNHYKKIKLAPENFASACLIAQFLERITPENVQSAELMELIRKSFDALELDGDAPKILLAYFSKTLRFLGHIPNRISKISLNKTVKNALLELDPQLTLNARRTLGMFSTLESMRSS